MASKFFISLLKSPGRINVMLDGRFQTVNLDDLSQDKLQQLFDNGCPYVVFSDEGSANYLPAKKITTKKIKKP